MFPSICHEPCGGGGPRRAARPHSPPARKALLLREPERQGVHFFLSHWYRLGQYPEVSKEGDKRSTFNVFVIAVMESWSAVVMYDSRDKAQSAVAALVSEGGWEAKQTGAAFQN